MVRKNAAGDGNVKRLGPDVAVGLALLAVQAGLVPGAMSCVRLRCMYLDDTRRWEANLPSCKAMERDDPQSKNCGSGQRFCSAAISAKSIGVVAAVAATSQVGWGGGQRRA